jgi:hypothetical protein
VQAAAQAGVGDYSTSAVRQRQRRACSPEPLSGTQLDCQHRLALVLQDSAQSSHPPTGKKELTPEGRNRMEQSRLNAVAKLHAALAKSQSVACEA